ncbi:hypothetical protein EDD22DRAFT_850170 [Suillus occidentalis]|nr:hypothetical protein EDD22DRAFT_850170 [Suillus occidentalis]
MNSSHYYSSPLVFSSTLPFAVRNEYEPEQQTPGRRYYYLFINIATGEPKTRTSTGIVSCTDEVDKFEVVSFPSLPRIFLVDTPGFDHTYLGELEVFSRITNWLKDAHATIVGIIFLHDIAHDNYSSLNNAILTVQRLLDSHSLRNVILTTTNWSNVEPGERQKQLANTAWGDLIFLAARPDQFTGTQDSAWAIIESITQQPCLAIAIITSLMGRPGRSGL